MGMSPYMHSDWVKSMADLGFEDPAKESLTCIAKLNPGNSFG